MYTGADLAADGIPDLPSEVPLLRPDGSKARTPRPVLARDRVRHAGEPVALVVAETLAAARAAADLIEVDYLALPAVAGTAAALASHAPSVWETAGDNVAFVWRKGDLAGAEAALRQAAHVAVLEADISRVCANPLEARAALGMVDDDGRLVLYTSHQAPYQLRNLLAPMFQVAPDRVRVVAGDVGGSFGMKSGLHPEDVLILWAARRLGRPVRWASDRVEAFLSDDHARDIRVRAQLALDRDGRFLALRTRHEVNVGCYLSGRSLGFTNNVGGIAGVYRIGQIAGEIYGVFTHTQPTAPYRGAGRPEATYTIERLIDVAARQIGMDPFDLRLRNLVPSHAMPYDTGFTFTYDCGDFGGNMQLAARLADIENFAKRRDEAAGRGRLRGIGVCNPIEVAGGPFGRPIKDHAWVQIGSDGLVTIKTGAMSTGQGLETALAQLVAERLNVPVGAVAYLQGDTDQLSAGRGSGGSSAMAVSGTAVAKAVDAVLELGRRLAADLLEAAPADVAFADGRFTIVGTDRSVSLAEVASFAEANAGPGLVAPAEYQPVQVTFPNGCHVCEVEIDPETGHADVMRYVVAEDLGRVLNPVLAHGQLHGGIAQGLGQGLSERIVHDPDTAQLVTASFMDYAMPRAGEMPEMMIETREIPTAVNPLGAKGVGEAGTVGSLAASINAVCDALAPLGIHHIEMPATPARIWEAIHARKTEPQRR